MEIWHRIAINSKKDQIFLNTIEDLKIKYNASFLPGRESSLVAFNIAEHDPNWPSVSELIASHGASNMVETSFSEEEIRTAEWLRLITTFEQGYPQPKSTWPFKQKSYELLCDTCAIHHQITSIRLIKEPHLRNKSFMTTIWGSEVFCTPEVFESLKKIGTIGYEIWDVMKYKTEEPLQKIKQLYVPAVASLGFLPEEWLTRKVCPACGATKYYPHVVGKMKIRSEALVTNTDFILSHEWFGCGYLAWQEILVSNRVANLILDEGWQGVRLKVIEVA